jgi:carbamoyltransferase
MIAGLGGVARHGCVALVSGQLVLGVCEQERVTRVRAVGFNRTGLPDEALGVLLQRIGQSRRDVERFIVSEPVSAGGSVEPHVMEHVDHHFAHACTAYLSSPFSSAVVLVCDHEAPKVSVWEGRGSDVRRLALPWTGPGLADLYSRCAAAFGFPSHAGDQRLEALGRLRPATRDDNVAAAMRLGDGELVVAPALERLIEDRIGGERDPGSPARAALAASLQARIGELFLALLQQVSTLTSETRLCLAGSLFYHSSMNTLAKSSGLFDDVFVPVDPGNAGLAVGTALHGDGAGPRLLSPFLGPEYSDQEAKETLDNCKLQYSWESDDAIIGATVGALKKGLLVGWFENRMEWGPRALGARCILANPFAPYVLENLNTFLKRREPWRGYALSGLLDPVAREFVGPASAPFMEADFRPREPRRFSHVLPAPGAAIRVQTVGRDAPTRFRRLLEAFGQATGAPFLVNTSFYGFHEPIVCSPRDAIRVFYGSGLDLLVLGGFVLRK